MTRTTKKAIILLVILLALLGLYYVFTRPVTPEASTTATTTWKTYSDPDTGFTINYPSMYVVDTPAAPTGIQWGSRTLITISDPASTSTARYKAVPAEVLLIRQPVTASGTIYHTIADYQKSGTAAKMVQGVANPNGELVTVNGTQALMYHFPAGDATDISGDSYFFIKNDLIYEVGFNSVEPFKQEMLGSISWK